MGVRTDPGSIEEMILLILRLTLASLGLTLAGLCVWAGLTGHFLDEFSQVGALAWGKVSLFDLYLGFVLFAVIIALTEPVKLSAPLIITLFLLGNIVGAFWLCWRLPRLVSLLRQDKPA